MRLSPHADRLHAFRGQHLCRQLIRKLAAKIDDDQPLWDGQKRVDDMRDPDNRHTRRMNGPHGIEQRLTFAVGQPAISSSSGRSGSVAKARASYTNGPFK